MVGLSCDVGSSGYGQVVGSSGCGLGVGTSGYGQVVGSSGCGLGVGSNGYGQVVGSSGCGLGVGVLVVIYSSRVADRSMLPRCGPLVFEVC